MTVRTDKPRRPRKKRTIVEEEIPDNGAGTGFDDASEFDVALEGVDDTETLKEVLEQFGQKDNVLYRVYRQTPTGQSFAYESPTFDEAFLQRERGAGAYTVRIFINGRFKRSMPVLVDAPTSGTGTVASNPADAHSQFLEKLLLVLITQQQANGNGGTQHQPTVLELTQALGNLDGLRGKQESQMDMFLKGVDLAKTMLDGAGGAGDWKSELLKMGRDALPAITGIVQDRMKGGNGNGQPATTTENPPVINPDKLSQEQKNMMLLQAIGYLKQQCFAGLEAESALNMIVVNSGNPQYQAVIKAVIAIPFEDLVKLDAEIEQEPFHVFFRTIHDGLRQEFGPEDSVDNDTGGYPGDAKDTGIDGDSSAKG